MLASAIALALGQTPPPPRTHQPVLVDPGLHGGRIKDQVNTTEIFDATADLTPDGRVMISFRQQLYDPEDENLPNVYLWALVASAVDTERINSSGTGHLASFYDPLEPTAPNYLFGHEFTFGAVSESNVIYWSPPFVGADTETNEDDELCILDTGLPLPTGGAANITMAMLPLSANEPHGGENPYPSDDSGNFQVDGGYRTYWIWLVTDHYPEYDDWRCEVNWPFLQYIPLDPPPPPRLVALKVRIILNLTGPTIHSAQVFKPYDVLKIGTTTTSVIGQEPSITADGTLIIFHGNATTPTDPDNKTSYVWNPNGCQPQGWSQQYSVTQVPPTGITLGEFRRSYGFAKYPIREPDNETFASGELLFGAYPWVSKDGSFFVAMHARATEVPTGQPIQRRVGMFVCGDITGGYLKHIDDTALNPTRLGGGMDWPQTSAGTSYTLIDTGRTTVFGPGLKPGLWEPFLGRGVPVPTQVASERIPILPLFVSRTRQYGEVRFEEADGNYLLYLACNESLRNTTPDGASCFPGGGGAGNFECSVIDPRETPDTSGRTPRARCRLNLGAEFPQEAVVDADPTNNGTNSAFVRFGIGYQIGAAQQFLHENVGYKGQAIVMSPEGCVEVETNPDFPTPDPWLPYGSKLTVQAFVKVVSTSIGGTLRLVEDPGRFLLKLQSNGSVVGQVTVAGPFGPQTLQVSSAAGYVTPGQYLVDPAAGWRHIAMVFDGAASPRLRLYGDGELLGSFTGSGPTSTIASPPSEILFVGPGRGTPSDDVHLSNMTLIMDEVAISSVARTLAEIKRDAYVAPSPAAFEQAPAAITANLPVGLEESETRWPVGLVYDAAKVTLGDALFDSTLLSKPGGEVRSCATCHMPSDFLTDNEPVATPAQGGDPLPFNAPTALNMVFGTHKLFDGSAASLQQQIVRPITGFEMGPQTIGSVLSRIKGDQDLLMKFTDAYGSQEPNNAQVSEANLKESLAMYVRTLVSGGSDYDFDAELRKVPPGSGSPLTALQQQGRALFFGKARCFGCHRGSNFSDDDFHNIGTVQSIEGILGRGGFTQRASENGQVKTPTLRNVNETGPYFHDGSKADLAAVIDHYVDAFDATPWVGTLDRQLRPLDLDGDEKLALKAFLESLKGNGSE